MAETSESRYFNLWDQYLGILAKKHLKNRSKPITVPRLGKLTSGQKVLLDAVPEAFEPHTPDRRLLEAGDTVVIEGEGYRDTLTVVKKW
tara:strand:- start:247 stop:513 length:267 start_codon:yes stop_codon:yes gene_type:complete